MTPTENRRTGEGIPSSGGAYEGSSNSAKLTPSPAMGKARVKGIIVWLGISGLLPFSAATYLVRRLGLATE
jgi:hypothetical protein